MSMSNRNVKRLTGVLIVSIVAAAALAQPNPQQPPPPTGNGSISGTVLNSATQAPLPRAHVTLLVVSGAGMQPFDVMTNEEGKFSFESLPAARLLLSTDRIGFVTPAAASAQTNIQLQLNEKKENVR